MAEQRFLNVSQLGRRLGVTDQRLRLAIAAGTIVADGVDLMDRKLFLEENVPELARLLAVKSVVNHNVQNVIA